VRLKQNVDVLRLREACEAALYSAIARAFLSGAPLLLLDEPNLCECRFCGCPRRVPGWIRGRNSTALFPVPQ
jgi:hypothetical protein